MLCNLDIFWVENEDYEIRFKSKGLKQLFHNVFLHLVVYEEMSCCSVSLAFGLVFAGLSLIRFYNLALCKQNSFIIFHLLVTLV